MQHGSVNPYSNMREIKWKAKPTQRWINTKNSVVSSKFEKDSTNLRYPTRQLERSSVEKDIVLEKIFNLVKVAYLSLSQEYYILLFNFLKQ